MTGRSLVPPSAIRPAAAPDMHADTPIDIVYLWVDGNDPAWRRKRRAAADRLGAGLHEVMGLHGNVEGRFRVFLSFNGFLILVG